MFELSELVSMGIRQKGYWFRQADAIRRQNIAAIAHGVGIGMSGSTEAMDGLELSKTTAETKRQASEATWNMLKFMKGGTGV